MGSTNQLPIAKDFNDYFTIAGISKADTLNFLEILELFNNTCGAEKCWCIKKAKNKDRLDGFDTFKSSYPSYLKWDARRLSAAVLDQYETEEKPILFRVGSCTSKYCINPLHVRYGTKRDVAMVVNEKKGRLISEEVMQRMLADRKAKKSYAYISREYKIPYHTVRRVCTTHELA